MKASLQDEAQLARHGYVVEDWGAGYVLLDPEGASLQITGYGGVCPRRWMAVAEGLERIADNERPRI